MLASRSLPQRYAEWNRQHHAPYGRRRILNMALRMRIEKNPWILRYCTPYAWQANNTMRRFEYPWAFEQVEALGQRLRVLDIGAGMAGFQYTLAKRGHEVHAVDPGMKADGKGWELDSDFHALLGQVYRSPVKLWPSTIAGARFEDKSFDVVVSISAIEHFASSDFEELASEIRRVLKPSGLLILTVDLFLDLIPFTSRETNIYGRNVNIKSLLKSFNAELINGTPDELYGFEPFDAERVQSRLGDYMIGEGFPGLSQCFTARLLD